MKCLHIFIFVFSFSPFISYSKCILDGEKILLEIVYNLLFSDNELWIPSFLQRGKRSANFFIRWFDGEEMNMQNWKGNVEKMHIYL